MKDSTKNDWFEAQLRHVLTHLYDPQKLRQSPLVALFGLQQRRNVANALRTLLTEGIESLRPTQATPTDARSWRIYQILRRRYIEQNTQREVANNIGLSVRQLQREEKAARDVLAAYLWKRFDLDDEALENFMVEPAEPSRPSNVPPPTQAQEFEWIRSSVPLQKVDIGVLVSESLRTVAPLLEAQNTAVHFSEPEKLPQLLVRPPLLRQALVTMFSEAIYTVPEGQVAVEVVDLPHDIEIVIQTHPPKQADQMDPSGDNMAMVKNLVELCRGTLEIVSSQRPGDGFAARLTSLNTLRYLCW